MVSVRVCDSEEWAGLQDWQTWSHHSSHCIATQMNVQVITIQYVYIMCLTRPLLLYLKTKSDGLYDQLVVLLDIYSLFP